MVGRRLPTLALFPAFIAVLLCPTTRAATLRQAPYCDGQGVAFGLGFEYDCPDRAVNQSVNDANNPADSCEAIQRIYPPAPSAPYYFYNTVKKCHSAEWTRVENATLVHSVENPAGVPYEVSWGGGEHRNDTDAAPPNVTYESLTNGRSGFDGEPMWRSGDTGDGAWLQASFDEDVAVNEVWIASGADESFGNCGNRSTARYALWASSAPNCAAANETLESFGFQFTNTTFDAPEHDASKPPQKRAFGHTINARCLRIYPVGDAGGTNETKAWGCLGEFRPEYGEPNPKECSCESGACVWGEAIDRDARGGGPKSRGPTGRYVRVVTSRHVYVSKIVLDGHFIAWNLESLDRFDESGMPEDIQLAVRATASSVARTRQPTEACYTYDAADVDPAERSDACEVNVWKMNSLNDPYAETDKKAEVNDPEIAEWIELDLGEDQVVDGLHIKFRDEESNANPDNEVTSSRVPYFEILNSTRDRVYVSKQRCNRKNCLLDLTTGPDAYPRNAGNDRLSDTQFDPNNWFVGNGVYMTNACDSRNDGLAKCREQCACMFEPSCDTNTVTYQCNDWCVRGVSCSNTCGGTTCSSYINPPATFLGGPFTRNTCLDYCTLAYEYNGNRNAAATALSTETPTRDEAIEWDRVVAYHRNWRSLIELQPYAPLDPSALLAESIAAGNAVKSKESPLGATVTPVECSDEGFGVDKNDRSFAPGAKRKECWCRTRGLEVTKKWCAMKSDPALSNFDPPVPYVPSPVDPPCTVTIDRGVNGKHVLFEDEDGWLLILAYNRRAGENKDTVNPLVPSSPTKGYSHYWPSDMGLTASDIAEVRFYCHTSNHNRVINFSTKNDWVRTMILNGQMNSNTASHWNSGTTKLKGHTGFLPDTTTSTNTGSIESNIAFKDGNSHQFAFNPGSSRWQCDDNWDTSAATSHQIWIKLAR